MLNTQFVPGSFLFIVFILFSFSFIIQLLYYWVIFLRIVRYKDPPLKKSSEAVSVVVCARNEYHHLKDFLPLILEQDHPAFEVVVVNHASDDDTSFLLDQLSSKYPHLKIVEIKENLNFFTGKKFPLSIGIKSAANDIILLTDADCFPAGKHWITQMQSSLDDQKEIMLGYGAYAKTKKLLNKLIRFDTSQIAVQYFSYALAGIPYMGVGRNMAYRKSLFFRNQGFISHYRIISGDDDLFINHVATRKNTGIVLAQESFTFSEPKQTPENWFRQKRRHLTTARMYRPIHKLLLGLYSLTQLIFWISLVMLLSFNYNVLIIAPVFALKMFSQYYIFGKSCSKLGEKDLVPWIPFYEIILLLLNSLLTITGIFTRTVKWR